MPPKRKPVGSLQTKTELLESLRQMGSNVSSKTSVTVLRMMKRKFNEIFDEVRAQVQELNENEFRQYA